MPSLSYADDILTWRREKEDALRRRDGWLALAGLHWLEPGSHTAGSSETVDIRLPASAPPRLGTFDVHSGQVLFRRDASLATPLQGEPPGGALRPDTSEAPDFLRIGAVTLVVIERAGRLALRVWDNDRPQRSSFPGRAWFPIDPSWSVTVDFETATAGRTITIPDEVGGLTEEPLLGTATFAIAGQPARLDAVPSEDGKLWFLFVDATNGESTYKAGRFLVAEPPHVGLTTLDFNRAYHPPCAFTAYATCPLPPDGNRLPMRIEAGERLPDGETGPDRG